MVGRGGKRLIHESVKIHMATGAIRCYSVNYSRTDLNAAIGRAGSLFTIQAGMKGTTHVDFHDPFD